MKKLLTILLICVLLLPLVSCESKTPQGLQSEQPFVSGEKVACYFGESFEMNILGRDGTAQIQKIIITKNKEADFNNLEDYWYAGSSFFYKRFI